MASHHVFPFLRLKVYRSAVDASVIIHRIRASLPDDRQDIAEMLARHSTLMVLKIARGRAEVSRAEAYRTFRISQRSTEQCHSLIERLELNGLGEATDLAAAVKLLERVRSGLQDIIDSLKAKLDGKNRNT